MRLYDQLKFVKGVGPKRADLFSQLNVNTIADFLSILPRTYLTKQHAIKLAELKDTEYVTAFGKVLSTQLKYGKRKRFVVTISDGTGTCQGVWFNYISSIEKKVSKGMNIALTGKVGYFQGFQIVHPELEVIKDDASTEEKEIIVPVYPIPEILRKASVSNGMLRSIINSIFEELIVTDIEDSLPESIRKKYAFNSLYQSLKDIHCPEILAHSEHARKRLRYQELLYLQLYLILKKNKEASKTTGIVFEQVGDQFKSILDRFPYDLTDAQKRVIKEIRKDMKTNHTMNRLVQGDVGSGKTIVALLCMAIAVDNNYQCVFMAPTEILAEQHYVNIYELTKNTSIRIALLVGKMNDKQKRSLLIDIQNGMIDIVIGTHAVIQSNVKFSNLGFVVIDEQHRFGVMQRAQLVNKGKEPDVLVMTATPIPRTMALTIYGDLDMSILDEKPAGRKEIKTIHRYDDKQSMTLDFIRERLSAGDQIYYVFPLIEESEKIDLKSAIESYEIMEKETFSEYRVGLLHGRMKSDEKDSIMQAFKNKEIHLLISTTVVEVGVDVPNATVMVIEHADRFGLSQLHQLRGRVGRSDKQSYCILSTGRALSEDAKERLKVMCQSNDGFLIAEEDLRIRGIGDLFGTQQSGYNDFRWANLLMDSRTLDQARSDAENLLEHDPHLRKEDHIRLRHIVLTELPVKYGLIDIA